MPEKKPYTPFVAIIPEGKQIMVTWGVRVFKKQEDDGSFSCVIPPLNIYFSASNQDIIAKKTRCLTKLYFDHYFLHSKNGIKKLALDLHKLGYKSSNDLDTLHKLVNNKIVAARFKMKSANVPVNFDQSESIEFESKVAVAC